MKIIVYALGEVGCAVASVPDDRLDTIVDVARQLAGAQPWKILDAASLPPGDPLGWRLAGDTLTADAAAAAAALANVASLIRVRRVTAAYGGPEKRLSLYGYMAQLNALKGAGTASADQAADLQTLLEAAAWEQAMLDAVPVLVAAGDAAAFDLDTSWPAIAPPLGAALTALALAS